MAKDNIVDALFINVPEAQEFVKELIKDEFDIVDTKKQDKAIPNSKTNSKTVEGAIDELYQGVQDNQGLIYKSLSDIGLSDTDFTDTANLANTDILLAKKTALKKILINDKFKLGGILNILAFNLPNFSKSLGVADGYYSFSMIKMYGSVLIINMVDYRNNNESYMAKYHRTQAGTELFSDYTKYIFKNEDIIWNVNNTSPNTVSVYPIKFNVNNTLKASIGYSIDSTGNTSISFQNNGVTSVSFNSSTASFINTINAKSGTISISAIKSSGVTTDGVAYIRSKSPSNGVTNILLEDVNDLYIKPSGKAEARVYKTGDILSINTDEKTLEGAINELDTFKRKYTFNNSYSNGTVVLRFTDGGIKASKFYSNQNNLPTISGAIAYRINNSDGTNDIKFCSDINAIRTFLNAQIAGSYAASNHNHDSVYAKLSGANFTGDIVTTGTVTASADLIVSSDERIKNNMVTINDALYKISQINGYTYQKENEDRRAAGVKAQEIEKVLPEAVYEIKDHNYKIEGSIKGISYNAIVGLLVSGINEEMVERKKLEERLNQFENQSLIKFIINKLKTKFKIK
jgi:hypothetical protein